MHDTDLPIDAPEPTANPAPADAALDGFEQDLDDVALALEALDADDLDEAEARTAAITGRGGDDLAPELREQRAP